jgi:outer membrane PBP1 activator LpoA protein
VKRLARILHRIYLKYRIAKLRSDMALANDQYDDAMALADKIDAWRIDAHQRMRSLRARFALIERPEILLQEALR